MKIIYLTAFLIFTFPAVVAAQIESNSVCVRLDKTQATSADIILTVCQHNFGMAPIPQPRLHFRLYKDGRAEFEANPQPDARSKDKSFKLVTRKFKVDAKTVAELVKLIGQKDFQNAKATYPRFRIWTDSSLKTTVYFRSKDGAKQVLLNNFSTMDEPNRREYPPSLFALMQKIEELKSERVKR